MVLPAKYRIKPRFNYFGEDKKPTAYKEISRLEQLISGKQMNKKVSLGFKQRYHKPVYDCMQLSKTP